MILLIHIQKSNYVPATAATLISNITIIERIVTPALNL